MLRTEDLRNRVYHEVLPKDDIVRLLGKPESHLTLPGRFHYQYIDIRDRQGLYDLLNNNNIDGWYENRLQQISNQKMY